MALVLSLGFVFAAEIKLEKAGFFEEVPNQFAISNPLSIDMDKNGNLYLLDGGNRTILVWDKQGKFLGNMGKPGNGPGELGMNNQVGFSLIFRNEIWVFDESSRRISIWGLDRKFRKTLDYPAHLRRVANAAAYGNKLVLVNSSAINRKQEIILTDRNLEIVKNLKAIEWNQYTRRKDGTYLLQPYAARLEMGAIDKWLYYSTTRDNLITRVDLESGSENVVRLALAPPDLTEEVKEGHVKNIRRWAGPGDDIQFPEKYDTIFGLLALEDNNVLVVTRFDEEKGQMKGLYYNHVTEKVSGSFDLIIAPNLAMVNSLNGTLYAVYAGANGDYVPRRLDIVIQPQRAGGGH